MKFDSQISPRATRFQPRVAVWVMVGGIRPAAAAGSFRVGLTALALGFWLCVCSTAIAWQTTAPKGDGGDTSAIRSRSAVDPRFRSPRATVRTFLIAMNQTEDDPHKIEEAVACFDLSGVPSSQIKNDRFATQLEFVLRSTNIPTWLIPDVVDGPECEIGEGKDVRLKLHRMPDGRWLFESKTIQNLIKMQQFLWERAIAAGHGKDATDVPADFRSPYAMFQTFTDAFKKGDLDTAAKCLDLSEIADPARQIVGRALAIKLKRVLDRTIFVIQQDLPDSSVGLPMVALVHKEGRVTAERLAAGARKGQWLFNRATVRSVERLYDEFEFKPIHPELAAIGHKSRAPGLGFAPELWLRHRMPAMLRYRLGPEDAYTVCLYQIIGLALLALLVVPIHRSIAWSLGRLASAVTQWRAPESADLDHAGWIRSVARLGVILVLIHGVRILDLRSELASLLLACLVPAFWLVLSLAAYQLIDPILKIIAGRAATRVGASTFAAMGYPVMSLVLKILVLSCGVAAVLKLFDFDVGTVLAGLGIGGLAFALAAQDTLKNFFGSLMLIADRTFRVGDLVQIGGNSGVVESVGLRTTRIRGLDDSLLTIPNSDLTTAHVTNFGGRRYRRFRTKISVPHGTPPDKLIAFRDGVLNMIDKQPEARRESSEVAVNNLEKSGVEILIQVFFDVPDWHAELKARESLILEMIRLADQLGIAPLGTPKSTSNGEAVSERKPSSEPPADG